MDFFQLKITRTILFTSTFGIIFLSSILIGTKPLLAGGYPSQSFTRCHQYTSVPVSVPEPYPFVGILAFSILSGGCLLKHRLRKKGDCLNNNTLETINNFFTSNYQQSRQVQFTDSSEQREDNYCHVSLGFELQLIDPAKRI